MRSRTVIKIVICFSMILGLTISCSAREWRGIVPLKSTRTDVERLLGNPTQSSAFGSYYRLADALAVIWFQTRPCDQCGLGWHVPAETVTSIGVIPLSGQALKPSDLKDFKIEDANGGFVYSANEGEGVTIETFGGKVTSFVYEPEKSLEGLHCIRQDCNVDFFTKFDEYGLLPWEDEKARLDNYAIRLKENLQRGAI